MTSETDKDFAIRDCLAELRGVDPLHPAVARVSRLLLKDSQLAALLKATIALYQWIGSTR